MQYVRQRPVTELAKCRGAIHLQSEAPDTSTSDATPFCTTSNVRLLSFANTRGDSHRLGDRPPRRCRPSGKNIRSRESLYTAKRGRSATLSATFLRTSLKNQRMPHRACGVSSHGLFLSGSRDRVSVCITVASHIGSSSGHPMFALKLWSFIRLCRVARTTPPVLGKGHDQVPSPLESTRSVRVSEIRRKLFC